MAIDANVFEMNMSQIAITCECTKEEMDMALTIYNGRSLEAKRDQA